MRIRSKHEIKKIVAGYSNSLPLLAVHDHDIDCRMTALEVACRLAITPKSALPAGAYAGASLLHQLHQLVSHESTNMSVYHRNRGEYNK